MLGDPRQEMLATFTSSLSLNENTPFRSEKHGTDRTQKIHSWLLVLRLL